MINWAKQFAQTYSLPLGYIRYCTFAFGVIAFPISGLDAQPNYDSSQSLTFTQAEQVITEQSYAIQAAKANLDAARYQAQATSHLWWPIVTLDARAIKYRTEVDVPLNAVKTASENAANKALQSSMSNLPVPLPTDIANQINNNFSSSLSGLLDRLPDSRNFVINDSSFRSTISAVMPLYTGGSIKATQNIANLGMQKSQLVVEQTSQQQILTLIEAYFGEQLAQQLLALSQQNLHSLTAHMDQATKLEQQGMINHGQYLQAEVAVQAAQRQYDQAIAHEASTRYHLQSLLKSEQIPLLATPLFVLADALPILSTYLEAYDQTSLQAAQLKLDQNIALENMFLAKAAALPTAYLFGQQTIDKSDWIIGIGARFTLISNIDRSRTTNAARARVAAAEALSAQSKQDTQQIIVRAYHEAESARKAFLSMQTDIKSAKENLRVQQLSFREGQTTAPFVTDAISALHAVYSDQATAAYRYDLAMATLLTATGQADQFKTLLVRPDLINVTTP